MVRDFLLASILEEPMPSVKRGDGIRDARAGIPKLSADSDYLRGYEMGRKLKERASTQQGGGGTGD